MHPLMMNWPENFCDRIKSLGDMFGTGVPTDTRMVQIYTDCFYSISRQMSPPVIHAVSLQQLDWPYTETVQTTGVSALCSNLIAIPRLV